MDGGKLPSRRFDRRGVPPPGSLQKAQLGKKGLLLSGALSALSLLR